MKMDEIFSVSVTRSRGMNHEVDPIVQAARRWLERGLTKQSPKRVKVKATRGRRISFVTEPGCDGRNINVKVPHSGMMRMRTKKQINVYMEVGTGDDGQPTNTGHDLNPLNSNHSQPVVTVNYDPLPHSRKKNIGPVRGMAHMLMQLDKVGAVTDMALVCKAFNNHYVLDRLIQEMNTWLQKRMLQLAATGVITSETVSAPNPQSARPIPKELDTPKARRIWERVKAEGWVDEHLQLRNLPRKKAAILAKTMADVLMGRPQWKPFETLWGLKNLRMDYRQADINDYYPDWVKTVKRVVGPTE